MRKTTTCVFMNGNSQAVRIPAEFRLDTNRVEIRRTANGDLLLHPLRRDRGRALWQALEGFNDLWIVCHALAEGATLVSHNLREFKRIEGLSLVTWVEP